MTQGEEPRLIEQYLDFVANTEPCNLFHRWSFMACIGAQLGRRTFLPFGHGNVYPTLYVMLMGDPGSRKTTAVKVAKKLLAQAGYEHFAATRTTKEKFLLDLEGREVPEGAEELTFYDETAPREAFIVADEFNEFIGINNMNFISTLGVLWDWDDGPYTDRVKNSKSVAIKEPTVSILGGNTPVNFAAAFPPEILGQGFFSRLLLIHGERVAGKRFTVPVPADPDKRDALVARIQTLAIDTQGTVTIEEGAMKILDDIYQNMDTNSFQDSRFDSYSERRFSHLLKIAIICTAMAGTKVMAPEHVIEANTILVYTEKFMPRALGEFGKSKNSAVANKVMDAIYRATEDGQVIGSTQLWAAVQQDLSKIEELYQIIANLVAAGKINQSSDPKTNTHGYLAKQRRLSKDKLKYVDFAKYLSKEEQEKLA